MKCKYTAGIALALTVIGALNWGLWGFFQFDLIAWLFGGNTTGISRLLYAIIGLAGLFSIKVLMSCCKKCACACHEKDHHDRSACDQGPKNGKGGCCGK